MYVTNGNEGVITFFHFEVVLRLLKCFTQKFYMSSKVHCGFNENSIISL